jgi:hypothetical protein
MKKTIAENTSRSSCGYKAHDVPDSDRNISPNQHLSKFSMFSTSSNLRMRQVNFHRKNNMSIIEWFQLGLNSNTSQASVVNPLSPSSLDVH